MTDQSKTREHNDTYWVETFYESAMVAVSEENYRHLRNRLITDRVPFLEQVQYLIEGGRDVTITHLERTP